MLNIQFIKNMTDLRLDPAKITQLARDSDNPVYIFNRGKPVSVLLDIQHYEEMIERLEDALDALEMRRFEKRPKNNKNWIGHEKLLKTLNRR